MTINFENTEFKKILIYLLPSFVTTLLTIISFIVVISYNAGKYTEKIEEIDKKLDEINNNSSTMISSEEFRQYKSEISKKLDEINNNSSAMISSEEFNQYKSDLDSRISEIEGNVQNINTEITAIKTDITNINTEIAGVKGEIEGLHSNIRDFFNSFADSGLNYQEGEFTVEFDVFISDSEELSISNTGGD